MTPTQARDEMYARVTAAWGEVGPIEYKDKPLDQRVTPIPPKTPIPWMRVEVAHTGGGATTIGNADGVKRYKRSGLFMAQVFTPMGGSMSDAEDYGLLVNHSLEDRVLQGEVLLRNVRMNEAGSDGDWFQTNVYADFEYDEVR